MTWEQVSRGANQPTRPKWWEDPNVLGVAVTAAAIIPNRALRELLCLEVGSPVMIFADSKNDAFAMRSPQPGEEQGLYVVRSDKSHYVSLHITCVARLSKRLPWLKRGTHWKATLEDTMVVVRNTL